MAQDVFVCISFTVEEKCEREKVEIALEERFLLHRRVFSVQGYPLERNVRKWHRFAMKFRAEIAGFLGLRSKWKDGSHKHVVNMFTAQLNAWVTAAIRCFVEKTILKGAAKNSTQIHTAERWRLCRNQLIGNARKLVKHRSGKMVTVEKDRLGGEEKKKAVMGMSAPNV